MGSTDPVVLPEIKVTRKNEESSVWRAQVGEVDSVAVLVQGSREAAAVADELPGIVDMVVGPGESPGKAPALEIETLGRADLAKR